ncbi:MAG: NAD(P)-dependent oxidoreductase [Pseudomonadota bacterium]|nr:NAD(P)-dependent oxidoreductase [Pseudomonadota bacterium]
MNVGFIGLGRMGGAMAGRLLAHGYSLGVYDRDPGQTAALGDRGAYVAGGVADLCRDRSLIISMLPDDPLLAQVASGPGGLCDSLAPGAIHMVCGTHGVTVMERLVAAHAERGQVLLSCTVLGRPDRAAEGKLGLIAGGPAAAIDSIVPLLEVLGERLFRAGANPLSAVAIKIANNFVLGCAIEAMGEGMALARKYDVDPELFHTVLTQGLFGCVAYQTYGDVIAKEDWTRVGATVAIGLKDAQLAFEAAEKVRVPLPSGNVWRDHLLTAFGRGEQALDWAVMAREQFRRSGLE